MIQLDTSFLIRALVTGSDQDRELRGWLRRRHDVGISAIAWTAFQCGPVSTAAVDAARTLLGEPIPFTAASAELSAALFNDGGRRRGTLVDCMIAATAIGAGDSMATANPSDFKRLGASGLKLA